MSFTLTTGYTWLSGDVVTATRLNTLPTVANNQSFAFADGTFAAPSISFNSDSDNGFYYIGANNFGIACAGASIGNFSTTGLNNCAVGATTKSTGGFTAITTSGVTAISMSATTPFVTLTGSSASQVWKFGDAGGFTGTNGRFGLYDSTNATMVLSVTPNSGAFAIISSGVTMSSSLTVTGAVTGLSFTATSGRRFKQKIHGLQGALKLALGLRPVTYELKGDDGRAQIGFIADEVAEIVPEVVAKDDGGLATGLDYGKLTAVLTGAIHELNRRMEAAGI